MNEISSALEASKLHDRKWRLIATAEDDDPVCIASFEAVTLSLGELWV